MHKNHYSGKPIRSLQTMIHALASVDTALETIIPDGIYGENTKQAVVCFQRVYGLPETGIVDIITWERIVEAFDHHQIINGPAAVLRLSLQPGQIILPGEENLHMHAINGVLQALSSMYESMPMAEGGNIHTDIGTDAVRWVQRKANMEQTGQIDRQTWRMIAALYRATADDGTGKRG